MIDMEQPESNRPALVGYARIFGVEISPEDTALEVSVQEFLGFLDDLDALDLAEVPPAAVYDPGWPRLAEVTR